MLGMSSTLDYPTTTTTSNGVGNSSSKAMQQQNDYGGGGGDDDDDDVVVDGMSISPDGVHFHPSTVVPRPTRESVLQRLSEALLRRSLAKVRSLDRFFGLFRRWMSIPS